MLITLKQKSVKVFKFYITTKFDSFLCNVRNVTIVFYFLCKLGFWPCLNMPETEIHPTAFQDFSIMSLSHARDLHLSYFDWREKLQSKHVLLTSSFKSDIWYLK